MSKTLVLGSLLLVLSACDAKPAATAPAAAKPAASLDDPQAFFDAYAAAIKAGDIDKVLPMIAEKSASKMREEMAKDPEKTKKNLGMMCSFQTEALQGCTAAAPTVVDGETRIVYTKPHIVVTARLVKEGGGWKILKVGIDDKTPAK